MGCYCFITVQLSPPHTDVKETVIFLQPQSLLLGAMCLLLNIKPIVALLRYNFSYVIRNFSPSKKKKEWFGLWQLILEPRGISHIFKIHSYWEK